jgi:prepilin-type N-terminal cleavage/methylation domain-containing protein
MKFRIKPRVGFTLLELLVVVTIIVIVAARFARCFGRFRRKAQSCKRKRPDVIKMAMDKYKEDFGTYPPDDTPSSNGSEMVWYYLCRVHAVHEMHYGPYIKASNDQLKDAESSSGKMFVSPLGGEYKYAQLIDPDGAKRMYVLVDPGEDKQLGGSIDPAKGFVEDDQTPAKDNISSLVQLQPGGSK